MSLLSNSRFYILFLPVFIISLYACEQPNSANFKVNHTIKTPLLAEQKMVFLGGEDAIVDTTSSEFDSLFSVDQQAPDSGLVSLSKEQDLSLGSLSGALPTIQSDPNRVGAKLGKINGQSGEDTEARMGNFSPDFSGSGQASFKEVVGQDPPADGQPLPAGSNTVRIPLNMDSFVSATIESGSIKVVFNNNLGFNISRLEIQLYSNIDEQEKAVGTQITNGNVTIEHGDTYSDQIDFESGDRLEVELEAEVYLEWNQQSYQGSNNPSMNVQISDQNLVVSKATSNIPQQSLDPSTPAIQIGSSKFEFATLTNQTNNGSLNQLDLSITNNTNLPLTNGNGNATPALTLRNSDQEVIDSKKSLEVEGRPNATEIKTGESATVRFDLSGEKLTRNVNYELDLGTSGGDNLQVSAGDKVLIQSSTTQLEVREAKLKMDSESLETSDTFALNNDEFKFTQSDHYVKLDKGALVIDSLVNQLDMDIPKMKVKIKDILTAGGDTLVIDFEGSSDGPAGSYQYRHIEGNENAERDPIRIDLSGFRINALNNNIDYVISGRTEDTGNNAVTVRSSDEVGTNIQVKDLEVDEARGMITEKRILLNEDDPANGEDVLDLFNNREAEIQKFDDLKEISERIGETRFFNTAFDLLYDVNLGVPANIYGVIVGINEEGKKVYLKPKQGSKYFVDNPNRVDGLKINGEAADISNVLKLPIETADKMGNTYHGAIRFDQASTNVDDFLSNFPTEIRFIGKAIVNPRSEEGFVVTPINFNSSVGFEIPINLANTAGSDVLQDTVEANLSDILDIGASSKLQGSAIKIKYENMLPFNLDLELKFLGEQDSVITTAPLSTENPITVKAPDIDPQTRYANTPYKGEVVIDFTKEQAQKLHKTRKIRLGGSLTTPSATQSGSHRVKIRKDDYFKFKLIGDFKIQTTVSGSGNKK